MQRMVGTWLVVAGTILFGVSVLADFLPIGNGRFFGARQLLGTIAGCAIAALGLVLFRRAD